MAWMIGIDEAGYGPNLGPLVVAATAWRVEGRSGVSGQRSGTRKHSSQPAQSTLAPSVTSVSTPVDLYSRLSAIISREPSENRIAVADSKSLYKPGSGLRQLERAVLTGTGAQSWQELFASADPAGHRHSLPWYADYDTPLPLDLSKVDLTELTSTFREGCRAAKVELVDIRTKAVFPREFNDLTDHHGTKGAALSHISIALLKEVLTDLPPAPSPQRLAPSYITCDKHGGRNRYAALLQHHFPDQWIDTIEESRAASRYAWGPSESRCEVCFRTKGEAELPTALASMSAKYHRELAMRAFNAFWTQHLPDLRPTAGYPVDAKRFKAAIADKQRELGIDDRDLWRNR